MEYNKRLYDSLLLMVEKYDALNKELETVNLPISRVTEINKQISKIAPIKQLFLKYQKSINDAIDDEQLLFSSKDENMNELAKIDLEQLKAQIPLYEQQLKVLLLPVDPYDGKNVIVEMRPAAGGDESSIFTADLFETYKEYCAKQH
jgi:peptide chain release factor 1